MTVHRFDRERLSHVSCMGRRYRRGEGRRIIEPVCVVQARDAVEGRWSTASDGRQDLLAHLCPVVSRQNRCRAAATEGDGLSKGSHEILAPGAGSQVSTDLYADAVGQFIIDEGR